MRRNNIHEKCGMTEENEKMIVVGSNRRKKQSNRFIKPYFFNTLAPELNDSLMVHVSYNEVF